jgi:hypothetical protein
MANTVIRPAVYTGSVQELIWNLGNSVEVTAYLWGGGGGGGGNDSNPGGSGSGSGYASKTFTVNNGDVIQIAVGGGGGGGFTGTVAPGGVPGSSYYPDLLFNTRNPPPLVSGVTLSNESNGAWCSFLNTYGVWNYAVNYVDNTYNIVVPSTGDCKVIMSTDNYGYVDIDGGTILTSGSYTTTVETILSLSAGTHTIRIRGYNTGGPGGIGVTVESVATYTDGYSGGRGGNSGTSGSSGSGGGGGGATVLFLNSSTVAVAGGGGGGGGGGNGGVAAGENAPGSGGQSASSTLGQDGQNKGGDGGGGGAGGGGYYGGQGGGVPGGDQGGYAGVYGNNDGTDSAIPSGRTPGASTSPYYSTSVGQGGINTQAGTSGYAASVFTFPGVSVNENGTYTQVSKVWVKDDGVWKTVSTVWVNDNGTWKEVGIQPPAFTPVSGNFGSGSRPYD